MKRTSILGFVVLALLAGCSKNGEVADFVKENDAMVAEIGKATSADGAKKVFDAKKEEVKGKLDPIKGARGFQVSEESQAALAKSLMEGAGTICGLQLKAIGNEADGTKYKALCDEYGSLLKLD